MEEVTERNIYTNGIDNPESDGNTSFLRAARNGQLEKVLEHLKTNIDINTSNANGLNALHLASKDGHVDIVEELLKRGAIVDAATKKGNTALHIASLAGQEEVVKLLVHHGASVNVQSQNGFTPLYMAAQENHDNVVKFLLANGANQSLSTEDGFTPLAVAMQQGHDKVVTVLLENDTRGKVRLPALHIAAKKDDVRAAKLLLENDHNPDVTSKSGFTPLHIASHYGNQSIANLLIQKGADVNYSAKHNITPLHVAAKWGKNNMVAVLLEQGAHIEAKTRDGLTPLHCAARSGHEQVVDMLLEKSAPISSKTKNGLAPLHMAAQGDHVDAARILLYHRAPVDEVTVDYLTALHVAAHCGHVRVAKLLLDRQADANARALNGFTPLHIACKKNRIKVVELLLKHGACIGATTESGLTPLHVASFMGCMNIVIYLLQHDASPDIPTVRGETPLHLAARANQTDIIRILLRNGAQVDARAREQQTPLHIASRLGNVDIVMLLLQHGAKVDNSTKDMYTALHIAAKEGQDEVAAVLIENGASLNATTKKGFTPLHLAAKYGHLKVAKLLLQKEAPVDAQGKNGVTPLHVASHYDHQNVALLLLDKGASPHANAKNGHTPLHIAARKNQMDIAHTLLEYGAQPDAESKAGFTPLHLSSQEGHTEISALLLENKATPNHQSKNGLTPMHLCAQENKVGVAQILHNNGAEIDIPTKGGYTPLHIASHYGQADMVKFLLSKGADVKATTSIGYTPLHQAAQQGHTNIVNILLENSSQPNAVTNNGQTPLNIAQKLGYITVIDTLKEVTQSTDAPSSSEEKYRVVAPEAMQETYLSDSEEEGEDTLLGDQTYRYLTADEMKSLGDDSLPIDVTRDERIDSNRMVGSDDLNAFPPRHIEDSISPEHIHPNYVEYIKKTTDNVDISKHPLNIGFLVSFLVDARGGAMRGCRHSGVRVIVPPRCAHSPTRITCRYVRPQRTPHPPPLMEGEALASRVLELGPVGATFLGPVIIEVPHFAALRGKEREIVVLRSDNGESWKEHTVEATEDVLNEILRDSFDTDDLNQLEDVSSGRITRIVTQDFPQYFAVISRIRQEVHAIGPEGGMVSSTVVPQVQAVFPQGALTKKIKVGLQAQPIDPELTAKMLGHGVAVSPVVTVEPRRRKFHKAITLSMPAPRAHSQGMINQYSGSAPTLRLLCSITGGTSRAQWEDVTGSTPLTFVNDCVSFTTTVSARFWLMDCRNIGDATKMATELYREAIHVPFIAKFMVFAKRIDPLEARLRVFCMTDDKEDKTLEYQEQFTEIAKSRDVEVLEGKSQYIEFVGNLVPVTKSGEQLQFSFRAFKENRLPFSVRVKDQHAEAVSRCLFMREPKVQKGEPPQQPICILNILLPDDIVSDTISLTDSDPVKRRYLASENFDYYRQDPRLADISNLLGHDWVELANQLGLTTSEINVIKSEYPDSVAKQAQSMLRMWLSQSGNRAQANTLDNALRRIGRDDIVIQCLNEDNRYKQILRIRPEKEKYRLKEEISEQNFDKREDYYLEDERGLKTKTQTFDKYSAEEKVIEPSDEEDDFNKTVPEIREQIVKRLSNERTIPASSQRVEIVQEISSIKRQSLVEDKLAEAQQKGGSESIKIITVKPISKVSHDKKTHSEVTEVKTISPELTAERTDESQGKQEKSRTEVSDSTTHADSDTRDSILLEEVTHRLESKKPLSKLLADEDPKSPKFSRTPPPSPADFIMREKEATTAQEWCATKTELIDESTRQHIQTSQEAQGQTTSPQYLDKLEKQLLDKTVEPCVVEFSNNDITNVYNFKHTLDETNAFLKFESEGEPYDIWIDNRCKDLNARCGPSSYNNPTKKKAKKGLFKTLKSLVTKSTENLVTECEKMSPKNERTENRAEKSTEFSETSKSSEPTNQKETNDECDEIFVDDTKQKTLNEDVEITKSVKSNLEKEVMSQTLSTKITPRVTDEIRKETCSQEQDHILNDHNQVEYSDREATTDPIYESATSDSEVYKHKASNPRGGTQELEVIQKEMKSDSEGATEPTAKKHGIWSFLTKKPKSSTTLGSEPNALSKLISDKHFDRCNVTQVFLEQEQNNYYCGSLHTKHEVDLKNQKPKKKILEKTGICETLLSKLKAADSSVADIEEPSYIKFDEIGSVYDPVATVKHDRQKKVTFQETTPEEKLPSEEYYDRKSPVAERLICRLKENTDAQATNTQNMAENDSKENRPIKETTVGKEVMGEDHQLYVNFDPDVAFAINTITQTESFLETEKIMNESEKSVFNINKHEEIYSVIENFENNNPKSSHSQKEISKDTGSQSEDTHQTENLILKVEQTGNATSIMNEANKKETISDKDLIMLTDAFLKSEIDKYCDAKIKKKIRSSAFNDKNPEKQDESKKKGFFGLFSKKKKSEQTVIDQEGRVDSSITSNSEFSSEQGKINADKTRDTTSKMECVSEVSLNNTVRQSTKIQDGKAKQSCETHGGVDISRIEQEPVRNAISKTKDFLIAEIEFYDENNYLKPTKDHVDLEKKIIDEGSVQNNLSFRNDPVQEKHIRNINKFEENLPADNDAIVHIENCTQVFTHSSEFDNDTKSEISILNLIHSTDNFLSVEKCSYDSDIYQNNRAKAEQKHVNLNAASSGYSNRNGAPLDETNENIPPKETIQMEKALPELNSEYKHLNNDLAEEDTIKQKTHMSFEEMIQSSAIFLSAEKMKYNEVEKKARDETERVRESFSDARDEYIKMDREKNQNKQIPEKKSRRFLKLFGKKLKPNIENDEAKTNKINNLLEISETEEFLNTEKFFYDDAIKYRSNAQRTVQTTDESSANTPKTQMSSNKSSKTKGIFKIFSKKSEERDTNANGKVEIGEKFHEKYDKSSTNVTDTAPKSQTTFEALLAQILKANNLFKNCNNLSEITKVFLETEKNIYFGNIRSECCTDATNQAQQKVWESITPDESSERKLSEKPTKKKKFFKIFRRKSEEDKDVPHDVDVPESQTEQKSVQNKLDEGRQNEYRERFNIFGKKLRPVEKNAVSFESEHQRGYDKDYISLLETTNEFLHNEKNNHEDVRLSSRVLDEFHTDQLNGNILDDHKPKYKANVKIFEPKTQEKNICMKNGNNEEAKPKELISDVENNKLIITTESRKHESMQEFRRDETEENKKLKGTRKKEQKKLKSKSTESTEKEGKSKGIFKLFSRRSKSKERSDESTEIDELPNTLNTCKIFLQKEVEMYVDSNPLEPYNSTKSNIPKIDNADSKEIENREKLLNNTYSNENERMKDVYSICDSAAFILAESRNFQENFQPEKMQHEKNFRTVQNVQKLTLTENENVKDVKEYTAFDFIKDEVKNFEQSKMLFTDTIDSSFRVETEVEHIDGNEPKDMVTKKIIITEKLIEKPRPSSSNFAVTNINTENLTDIDENRIKPEELLKNQQNVEENSKDTSTLNRFELLNEEIRNITQNSENNSLQRKSRSKEKLECIEAEYVHKMKDLELAKGDVIEDVSPLERKIEMISNDTEEKVTDLDESLPNNSIDNTISSIKTITETKPISCIISESFEEPITKTQHENNKQRYEPCKIDTDITVGEKKNTVTKISDKDFQPQDVPETVQITESFMKELEIQFHPDKSIYSKDEYITIQQSNEAVDRIHQLTHQNEFEAVGFNREENQPFSDALDSLHNKTVESDLNTQTERTNSNFHENIDQDNRSNSVTRKPLFRLESDEDDFVVSSRVEHLENYETKNSENTSDQSLTILQDETKLMLENTVAVDSKSDVEMIEDKLRDLGKALDALEKLSEIKSDEKIDQIEEKKLRRIERKFERMASETLESPTNIKRDVQTTNSGETDRYQQLVSHLSTDEVISLQSDYSNLWDEYSFSKSDEWDSKTPESQADVLELPQGDVLAQTSGTTDLPMIRDKSKDSSTENEESQKRSHDKNQLSEEMKELLEEMEKSNKM